MPAAAHAAGVVAAACLLGGMVFFAAVLAPLVFTRLDGPTAGAFIRATFPRYYLFMIVTAGLGAAGLAVAGDRTGAVVLLLVALVTVWLRQGLMPRINALRDRELGGDRSAAAPFARAHRLSVAVNMAQLLAALAVVARIGG